MIEPIVQTASRPALAPAVSSQHRCLNLCVFIDGFGWKLFKRYGFLSDLLTFEHPVETVLGYSSTCDPTILTGTMPSEHLHFSFYRYDPAARTFPSWLRWLSVLPNRIAGRGRVRNLLSRWLGRWLGWTGYFQLYSVPFDRLRFLDYSEKRDIYQPGGIRGGQETLFDRLRQHGIPFHLSDWRASEASNISGLEQALRDESPALAYLFLGSLDGDLHREGTDSSSVVRKLRWYEQELRRLYELALEQYDEVHLSVFSDHGMSDVVETSDLKLQIEALGLRYGVDYAAVYDSTMARFWFLSEPAKRQILELLRHEGRGRILSESDLRGYGLNFPDGLYGELVFLMQAGVLLCPSDMGLRPVRGMHGYEPSHPDSVALFASTHMPEQIPHRLDDLHDVLLKGLEV
jgi:hypothetical protein